MKKLISLAALVLTLTGFQYLLNCADPLEPYGRTPLTPTIPGDTIFSSDTVVVLDTTQTVDTVFIVDSTGCPDTLFVIDTVATVDTVIVTDTLGISDTLFIIDTVNNFDTILTIDTLTLLDTISITDTIITEVSDTVWLVDTVAITDTVIVTDTVTFTDTVFVEIPVIDTTVICSEISCKQKKIVWHLFNSAGFYRLEFVADVEKNQPEQTLTITIDGIDYIWDPNADPVFILELNLSEHATIVIKPNIPPAFGHTIDICMKMSAL